MKTKVAIYARVSTHDQNTLPMQVKKCRDFARARKWEVAHVVKEIGSGANHRPLRSDLLNLCRKREVDVVIVWKLDRWGRSVSDVVTVLDELKTLGVKFVSITEALDFTTPSGKAMSTLLSVFAEFERDMIKERVKAGLEEAKTKGVRLGRPLIIDEAHKTQVLKLWKRHKNQSLVAREMGISRRSVVRIINSA
jgi:DNA invertase Pin-like site-specific DNA recombinase